MSNEVTTNEPVSDSEFIERITQFLKVSGWKANRLARSSGISTAVLSQFMSGKYPGDNDSVRLKIMSVLEREFDKMNTREFNPDFIETSISKRFNDVANVCRLENDLGVIYAEAGLGKTEAARQYISKRTDVILIEADPGYTASVLIHELYSRLGNSGKPDLHSMMVECIEHLTGSGRMIIIDEAEQLPYKALESIRRVHDKARVGVLLVGMPKLLANLRGLRGEYAQIYSRVGISAKINHLTQEDTKLIISRILGDKKDLWRVFHKESGGITRRLFKLIKRSLSIADFNNCDIDTEVVELASGHLKVEVMS